jgi:hypothetical protein
LAKQLISDKSFRWSFSVTGYIFLIVQAVLLQYWFDIPDTIAWTDSAIHVGILALCGLCISYSLAYYRPAKGRYFFLLTFASSQGLIWISGSTLALQYTFPGDAAYQQWLHFAVPVRLLIGWLILTGGALKSSEWYDLEEQKQELSRKLATENLAREAELYKLRQQLQPHFLFNSLNSINALIALRPQQAREMVLKLSDFLRGTLKREDQQWILLPEELQYLQWYLDIEKVRFGHRLSTEVNAAETVEKMMIPPMLLQPVVENAIKYGLYDTTEAITITIQAWSVDDLLYIKVQNPYDASLRQQAGTGFGLNSIRRRLYLLYARQDLLETEAKDNIYTTLIKVPQRYDKSSNN